MPSILQFKFDKKDAYLIFLILAIGILIRIFYLADYKNTEVYPVMVHSDGYYYNLWAKDIASGDLLGRGAFMKWPLYAYFLGTIFKLFGENITFIYLLQFIFGLLNCVLIYAICRIIFNRMTAAFAALLASCYGLFVFYEGLLIYTGFSILLNSALFLYFLHLDNKISKRNLFFGGVMLGICAITQGNILIFGILALFWLFWKHRLKPRALVSGAASFFAGLILIIGLVTLRNYAAEKDFVLIAGNTGINFYLGNNPQARGAFSAMYFTSNQDSMFKESRAIAKIESGKELKTSGVSAFWFKKSLAFIKKEPLAYLRLLGQKITYLFSSGEFVHDHEYRFLPQKIRIFKIMFLDLKYIMPLAFLGMLLEIRDFRKNALLYIAVISLSMGIIIFFVTARYRMSVVPFLIVFAAYPASYFYAQIKNRKYLKIISAGVALALIFLLLNHQRVPRYQAGYVISEPEVQGLIAEASIDEEKSDYKKALERLEIAIRINPYNHHTIFAFGSVYYHMGKFELAEGKFKEAMGIFPFYIDAYYNLGFLYNQEHRFDEAAAVLEKGSFLDPEDAAMYFELGRAYKAKKNLAKAKEKFAIALSKMPRWRKEDRRLIEKESAGL